MEMNGGQARGTSPSHPPPLPAHVVSNVSAPGGFLTPFKK